MNDYPEYVEVNGKEYKINTDFRIAIRCSKIAEDETIGDFERALSIIYLLFGEDALKDKKNYDIWLKLAKKYLACGKELENVSEKDKDMDLEQDMDFIEASFQSDYGIWLPEIKMHWWKFYRLLNGLSDSELGNCCILNRIRNLRNYDTSDIKDRKLKEKIENAKKMVALKKNEKPLTEKQKQSSNELREKLGLNL